MPHDPDANITESEETIQRIAASEAQYRMLADHIADVIVKAGPNGVITYASPSCRQLGVSPEQAIGRSTLEFVSEEDRENARKIINDLFEGAEPDRAVLREYRVTRADGSTVWMEGNPSVIRDVAGRPVEYITVLRDISARKQLALDLGEAVAVARGALKAKGEFLANVGHELRTPMTSILGLARVIADEADLPIPIRDTARGIVDAGQDLLATINELLDWSALSEGQLRIALEPFDLPTVLRGACWLLEHQANLKGVHLSFSIPTTMPTTFVGDAARIKQVLINLIGNAVKFTEVGTIHVSASQALANGMVRFQVRDTGRGISPSEAEVIFERFVRGALRHPEMPGSGLGLHICKLLVERMGGTIAAGANNAEGGSNFWFDLPLMAASSVALSAHRGAATAAATPGRVLLIEDNAAMQQIVCAILKPLGFHVEICSTGADGLMAARNQRFGLILIDAVLPDIPGATLAREIRALAGLAGSVRIVAMSAGNPADVARKFIDAGADGFLAKPIDVAELVAAAQNGSRLAHVAPPGY